MSLHADVAVPARDRKRLERMCCYVARPPIAIERLEALPDGRLAYRLKPRWRDGTTHLLMERRELLERLAPLIPPPRAHQARYHGLLAPCASGRDRVVPRPLASSEAGAAGPAAFGGGPAGLLEGVDRRLYPNDPSSSGDPASQGSVDGRCAATRGHHADRDTTMAVTAGTDPGRADAAPKASTRRSLWADLLQRVFEVAGPLRWPSPCESKIHRDALCCPRCGGRMRVLAAITEADVARRVLACLNLPTRAPPLAMKRPGGRISTWPELEPPSAGRTDALWSAFEFDQSTPAEWDVGA